MSSSPPTTWLAGYAPDQGLIVNREKALIEKLRAIKTRGREIIPHPLFLLVSPVGIEPIITLSPGEKGLIIPLSRRRSIPGAFPEILSTSDMATSHRFYFFSPFFYLLYQMVEEKAMARQKGIPVCLSP